MAEVFTGLAPAAAILDLIGFVTKVVTRVKELRESAKALPKHLDDLDRQTSLLEDILPRIYAQFDSDGADKQRNDSALRKVLVDIQALVQRLDELVSKLLPKAKLGRAKITWRGIMSMGQEQQIREMATKLDRYIGILTLEQVTRHISGFSVSAVEKNIPSQQSFLTVPFRRDPHFVGRTAILDELDQKLKKNKFVALSGMGGVGKSQIAIEYCFRFRDENDTASILWIHASTKERFAESIESICAKAKLPGYADPKTDKLAIFQEWLDCSDSWSWLIVLDSADTASVFFAPRLSTTTSSDTKRVFDFLPRHERGQILATTRDTALGFDMCDSRRPIKVEGFSPEEAAEYLEKKMENTEDSSAATSLFETLDYIPLAISQAVSYISHREITLRSYLDLISRDSTNLSRLLDKACRDERRDRSSVSSVSKTWQVSFEFLQANHPPAIEVFSLMAVLDRQNIPTYLLQDDGEDDFTFHDAVERLTAFSLVSIETSNDTYDTYEMHRLVQHVTRTWLAMRSTLKQWQLEAFHRVAGAFPFPEYQKWDLCSSLSPHGRVVCEYSATHEASQLDRARLLGKMGMYNSHEGKLALALQRYEQSLNIYDQHPYFKGVTSEMFENKAVKVLATLGRYEEAERMNFKHHKHRRRLYGLDHVSTIESTQILGTISLDSGRYVEAERVCFALLRHCHILYDAENTLVREVMVCLAGAYRGLGSYYKAEALLRRVVDVESRTLPWPHPLRMESMRMLAETLVTSLDDRTTPNPLILDGSTLYLTASFALNAEIQSARTHAERRLAKLREAKQLCDRCLPACATILGAYDLQTLATMLITAQVQFEWGNANRTEELALETLEGHRKTFGHEHPDTINVVSILALLWHKMGNTVKAEELFVECLPLYQKVHGLDSPETLTLMYNLAMCWHLGDKKGEALQLMSECVTLSKASLPDDDPQRLKAMATLQAWQADIDSDDE